MRRRQVHADTRVQRIRLAVRQLLPCPGNSVQFIPAVYAAQDSVEKVRVLANVQPSAWLPVVLASNLPRCRRYFSNASRNCCSNNSRCGCRRTAGQQIPVHQAAELLHLRFCRCSASSRSSARGPSSRSCRNSCAASAVARSVGSCTSIILPQKSRPPSNPLMGPPCWCLAVINAVRVADKLMHLALPSRPATTKGECVVAKICKPGKCSSRAGMTRRCQVGCRWFSISSMSRMAGCLFPSSLQIRNDAASSASQPPYPRALERTRAQVAMEHIDGGWPVKFAGIASWQCSGLTLFKLGRVYPKLTIPMIGGIDACQIIGQSLPTSICVK